jgi:diguanylate cyclase (GGDEF)-like protein/PAS domain S-box-containing protein
VRSAQRRALGSHEQNLLSAFDNAPVGMAVATSQAMIMECNPALGRLLDRDPGDLVGQTFFDVTHPDDVDDAKRTCVPIQTGATRILRHECRFVDARGRTIWVAASISRVTETADRPAHLIVHVEDITDRKRLEAELSHRALHDPLTGLANRALLIDRIRAALGRHGRHARPSHLFFLDLNGFKEVNDRFGHVAGDAVLTQLAQRIVGLLRVGDTASRIGGDEFVVLCEDAEPCHAVAIGQRLSAAAAEPFLVNGATITLSAAIGSCPAHDADPADLLREADRRMYETKRRRAQPSRHLGVIPLT